MKVKICVGTTCHLMGSSALIDSLADLENEVSKNVELEYSTCFSACQGEHVPPVVEVKGELYGNMTPLSLRKLLYSKMNLGEKK